MKRIGLFFLIVFAVINLIEASDSTAIRTKENFNENWKFILEDNPNFCEADFDDSSWRELSLPHDWSVKSEFSKSFSGRNGWLPGGIAWYRKSFDLPGNWETKNIEIQVRCCFWRTSGC